MGNEAPVGDGPLHIKRTGCHCSIRPLTKLTNLWPRNYLNGKTKTHPASCPWPFNTNIVELHCFANGVFTPYQNLIESVDLDPLRLVAGNVRRSSREGSAVDCPCREDFYGNSSRHPPLTPRPREHNHFPRCAT
jgi:hypothetical protein